MKKFFLLTLFFLGYIVSNSQDYNKLDPEYISIAKDALSKLSEPNRQWFTDKSKQHPPGDFNTEWTKQQLAGKFTANQVAGADELLVCLMAYLKMVNKEVREDRKLSKEQKSLELKNKEMKLEKDNKSIDAGMNEAKEKADNAMTAATTSQAAGVAQGVNGKIKLRSQLAELNKLKL